MKMDKKGVIDQLLPVIIALVSIGITIVVAFLITANIAANSQVAADGNATLAIDTVNESMADIPAWLPIIIITIIGALLIGLVALFRRRA